MLSPLIPFEAHLGPADGTPYLMKMSQGFNEAIWFSGAEQSPALAKRIESLMGALNGKISLSNIQDTFLARLMALTWHLEYLVTALTGNSLSLDDHNAFLNSLGQLSQELMDLRSHPVVGEWVIRCLQDAQYRHFQRYGHAAQAQALPEGPVSRPIPSRWTGLPHLHAPLLVPVLPPLAS
jgi:hypothetical protein